MEYGPFLLVVREGVENILVVDCPSDDPGCVLWIALVGGCEEVLASLCMFVRSDPSNVIVVESTPSLLIALTSFSPDVMVVESVSTLAAVLK